VRRSRGRLAPYLVVLTLVALASAWVRYANNLRIAESADRGGNAAWFSSDPDSLYHMRRLERALDEGWRVAARDPLLPSPGGADAAGAPIPWPGAYTRALLLVSAPFAPPPEDAVARERFVERVVATWPFLFGVATSVLVAATAGLLAGRVAAVVAGLYHATLFASMKYSYLGLGDHHAWISMLHAAWLFVAARGLARLDDPRRAAVHGAVAGILAGLALASWVATLVALVLFQVALAWLLLRHVRNPLPGLAGFGLAFHLAALVCLLPEVLASPWGAFELVNLSWLHAGELALGAAVFLPLLGCAPERDLTRYPWLVASLLGFAGAVLALGTPLGDGIAEGLSWAGGTNAFMGWISESQPLIGGAVGGIGVTAKWLGWGVFLLPLVWLAAWRSRAPALLPWVTAVPALLAMALLQRRFGDGLAAPMAVLLGWGVALALHRFSRPRAWSVGLLLCLTLVANPGPLRTAWNRTRLGLPFVETETGIQERALREGARWIRERGEGTEAGAVLAQWDVGHLVEWVARRRTLATNFGRYLGDGWLDPWRYFLMESEERGEALLEARGVEYILVAADWARNRTAMERVLGTRVEEGLIARLLPRGTAGRSPELDDLSGIALVHVAPRIRDGRPSGAGAWVLRRVRGALVEVEGKPGERLVVELEFEVAGQRFSWRAGAAADARGRARLRVPYGTASSGKARWRLGTREGLLAIPAEAVEQGLPIFPQ